METFRNTGYDKLMPDVSDTPPKSITIDEKDHLAARYISLYRGPTSPNAQRCVQDVLSHLTPELNKNRHRKLGQKAQERLVQEMGSVSSQDYSTVPSVAFLYWPTDVRGRPYGKRIKKRT